MKKLKIETPILNSDARKSEQIHNSSAKELKIYPNYKVKKPIIYNAIIKKSKKKPKKTY